MQYISIYLRYFLPLVFVFGGACFSEAQRVEIRKQFIFPLQDQHVHSSSLVALPSGDLLACWFQGSGERKADDVQIMGARLKKGARQWGDPFLMADTPGFPDCNPVLFLSKENELFLFWMVIRSNRWEEALLKYKKTKDFDTEAAPRWTWQDIILLKPGKQFQKIVQSKFEQLPDRNTGWAEYAPPYERMIIEAAADKTKKQSGWMTRTKPLQLASGRILLPLYSDGFNFSIIAISDDQGEHWHCSEPLVGYGNVQPTLVEKQNGDIMAYMRDNGDPPHRVMQSQSNDQGQHWEKVIDLPLDNPGSSLHTLSLDNGHWLMVNNNLESGRNVLNLNLSTDQGKTWRSVLEIEKSDDPKIRFAYPTLIKTSNGEVHLSYSLHTNQKKSIVHALISL
jgi:predicted neuraminidase